jgi:hypothetical protein
MLYIDYGVTSSVTVTLWDKCQNMTNPVFTWLVDGGDNKQQYIFSTDDFSSDPWYYNQFTISSTLLAAPSGQYVYTVYEMATYSLDLNNAIGQVETGIINIVGTASAVATFRTGTSSVPVFKK